MEFLYGLRVKVLMRYEYCIVKKDVDEEIIEYYILNRGIIKIGGLGIVMM